MSIKKLGWAIPILLLFSFSAKADGFANIYFNGGYAFGDNGYGIPPYSGTLNGQNAEFYCVDFSHDITGNTGWQATVTPITPTTDYTGTRLDNATDYDEIVWLLDQSLGTTDQTTQAELQWAVWSFSGGGDPYSTNGVLLGDAANAIAGGFQASGWDILTPTGNYGQEFLVQTPEPSSIVLLGIGLMMLITVTRRKCFGVV